MTLKDRYYAVLDAWDGFIASPWKTHLATAFCGAIVALYLRSLL